MQRGSVIRAIALYYLLFSGLVYASERTVEGVAFDIKTNKFLYQERHTYSDDGLNHRVVYTDENAQVIAEKTLNYHRGLTTPEYTFHHQGLGEKISSVWVNNAVQIDTSYLGRTDSVLLQAGNMVVDAGFVYFIRSHWPGLLAGESLTFSFPLPRRGRMTSLRVATSPCFYPTKDDQCFTLVVNNWLLRMLVDPIELGFNQKNQALTRYRGVSNLLGPDGEGLFVDIHYRAVDQP